MRLAVLILNYIVATILALAFIGLAYGTNENQAGIIIEMIIIGPAVVMSLVYAHSQRNK